MTITVIILTILICLVTFLILNEKINKIKKDYIKSDLVSEMNEIITYFNQEADRNISLLEEKIKQIDNKIKRLEKIKKSLEEKKLKNQNKQEATENIYAFNSDSGYDIELDSEKKNEIIKKNKDINKKQNRKNKNELNDWQEQAYGMFSNGFSIEQISLKLNKNIGEVQFAINYIEMKKRINTDKDKE